MRNEDLDVVDVTTGGYENGSWHFEPAMEALEAGKHVLVEKPISNDVGEARQMVAKAAEKDLYLGCNLNHYFTPPAEQAREYMDEGRSASWCTACTRWASPAARRPTPTIALRASRVPVLPREGLPAPSLQRDALLLRRRHARPGLLRPPQLPQARRGPHAVDQQHPCAVRQRRVGYLLSQRGDATFGLGGWWSVEVGGTQRHVLHRELYREDHVLPHTWHGSAAQPDKIVLGSAPKPVVTESGITDFNQTFPRRIHAFLEDVTNGVAKDKLRASGRDALAALEYTWAAMESYESGGELVQPHALPTVHGDPRLLA